jgi:type IV pilus assembly protein PilN
MIKINLLGEKEDVSTAHFLQLMVFSATVFISVSICFFLYSNIKSEKDALSDEKGGLQARLAEAEKKTKQVDELEKKRKLLREKLITIASLKMKKSGPVHTLNDLNMALPERSWLTSLKQKAENLEAKGIALDNQTVAMFMSNLKQSQNVKMVDLIESSELIKDDVKLKQFTVSITLRDPLELKKQELDKELNKKST